MFGTNATSRNAIYPLTSISILVFYGIFFIFSFLFNNPLILLFLLLLFFIEIFLTKNIKVALVYLRFSLFLVGFIALLNIIFISTGDTILYQTRINFSVFSLFEIDYVFKITLESIVSSWISIERLLLVILLFGLMNAVVSPDELMQVLIKCRIPPTLTLIITLSFQFFPILLNDLDQLKQVQKTQGIQFDSGKIFTRIKNNVNLLLPLLTNSLERATQISEALETRGFGSGKSKHRTQYKKIKFSLKDLGFITLNLLILSFGIYSRLKGIGYIQVYPALPSLIPTRPELLTILLLGFTYFILYSFLYVWRVQTDD
jgi:energy-coupling factor transport system permease protein